MTALERAYFDKVVMVDGIAQGQHGRLWGEEREHMVWNRMQAIGENPNRGVAVEERGLAAMIVCFVGGVLKHKTLSHMVAQVCGIAAMLLTMHNLVWFFPAEFAQAFSQVYVEQVTQTTAPLSIHFNGETIVSL